MVQKRIDYSDYCVEDVTNKPDLWEGKDPVRPWLSSLFRSTKGRAVYALRRDSESSCDAFLCLARTSEIPASEADLKTLSSPNGVIAVPYTVWSYKAGAGKEIVKRVIALVRENSDIKRVITLSPVTRMARRFHLKNGAKEVRKSIDSVNFEY